jgi:hypothetical protein
VIGHTHRTAPSPKLGAWSPAGPRYLAVHGHFYQPPREDPFTGRVPREAGAEPFHDFNEKILAECYRPNARLGNFGRMSFDLGPTLAAWLERHDPETYRQIVAQERAYFERHGHGNALAHVYGHAILPLASEREKAIQVAWGLADFRHRFGHDPDGMWLAETAADSASLGALLDHGVRFTILAPWQSADPIDPTEPYWVRLGDGRRIAAFFYNGDLSGRVSFDSSITTNADTFGLHDLARQVNREKAFLGEPQLTLIATDGELYGHHLPYRDKFLEYLLTVTAPARGYEITSLGRYLAAHPPRREVRLAEATSWSCHHGVERWRGDCACTEGPGAWKWHLRHALAGLAARIDALYEVAARKLLRDSWAAEAEYVWLLLGAEAPEAFWQRHARRPDVGRRRALALLAAQHSRHLMFASCAWFFDDLDRIEPRNAIGYGLRALREAERAHRVDLLAAFASDLRAARSWRTGRTGADLLRDIIHRTPGLRGRASCE